MRPRLALHTLVIAVLLALSLRPYLAQAPTVAPCAVASTQLTPDGEEQRLVALLNAYRASYGLTALQPSSALTTAALWKADDMATYRYVAHDDTFRSWSQRFADCGYATEGATVGENLAAGPGDGAAVLALWQASPEHDANLLNPAFVAVGVKRVAASDATDSERWYWALDFGSVPDAPLSVPAVD